MMCTCSLHFRHREMRRLTNGIQATGHDLHEFESRPQT